MLQVMILGFIVGVVLAAFGLRGRLIGKHLYCTSCGFDLSGQFQSIEEYQASFRRCDPASVCPECGTALMGYEDAQVGRREHRRALIWVGLVLVVLTGMPLAAGMWKSGGRLDWLRMKPEGWLLRDAVRFEDGWRNYDPQSFRNNMNLVELYRRASSGELSDYTLLKAMDAATKLMDQWPVSSQLLVPQYRDERASGWSSRDDISWADLGLVALYRGLLTQQQRTAYCTSTGRLGLIVPQRIVQGDPLPVSLWLQYCIPNWNHYGRSYWPIGRYGLAYSLDTATIDGRVVQLAQFCADGSPQQIAYPYGFDSETWLLPREMSPGADLAPGKHTLRVSLRAWLDVNSPLSGPNYKPHASAAAFGFPDEGWIMQAEVAFEVVAGGSTRAKVPLRGDFAYHARLRLDRSQDVHYIQFEVPHTQWPSEAEVPIWMREGDILAAQAELRVGDKSEALGPIVIPRREGYAEGVWVSAAQMREIALATEGEAVVVLTPDAELAKLVATPGALIVGDPIVVPIEVSEDDRKFVREKN